MLTSIKGAIAEKNTKIGDVVAGGKVVHGTITSKSEFSEDVIEPKGTITSELRRHAARLKKSLSNNRNNNRSSR